MAVDVASLPGAIRHRFPILEQQVYVNSCAQGALSDAVRDSYTQYLRDWEEQGSPWEYWVERAETARDAFARLVNAHPDEVAVATTLSSAVIPLASGLRFDRGRPKVVVSDFEFPTTGQIWHAQEAHGAHIVHVPANGAEIPIERFDEAIDEQTVLVSISHVCFRNGSRLDVEAVTQLAHDRGALVLLDAYQSIGSLPIDVRALGVDFLAAGVHKYLLGSAGLAFLYCRRELVETIEPTAIGWFGDRDIFEMDIYDYSPAPTARRFQMGTPPVPATYAGIAGIELMLEIGIAETAEHVRALNDLLIEGVDELGGRVVTPRHPDRRGALICIASKDADAHVAALGAEGVVTSTRDGNIRISPHCYNSAEDIAVALGALARHRELLA